MGLVVSLGPAGAEATDDGQAPATEMRFVGDVGPGPATALPNLGECRASPEPLCVLTFQPYGAELWRITAEGSLTLVADLAPGKVGSAPHDFTRWGDSWVFLFHD